MVDTNKKYFTVKEVAELLSVAEITVRKHIQYGKVKIVKFGRATRIHRKELLRLGIKL